MLNTLKPNYFSLKNLILTYITKKKALFIISFLLHRDGPRWGPRPPRVPFFFFFFVILCFIFVVGLSFSPNQFSLPNPNSNYQTQKFNKNNKNIHNGDCILANNKLFYHQRTKKSCVIGKAKAKFFATIVYLISVDCNKFLKIK